MSLAFFIVSAILGLICSKTIQRIVNGVIEKVYNPVRLVALRAEDRIMEKSSITHMLE